MASSDLELLCSHVNEKIGNIKKTLSLRNCGQEPTLKTMLNKIGDEIIVVNELLNKLELEIQHQEQTNNSLKELCESLEEDYKDVEHLKETIPSIYTVAQPCSPVKGSDLDPEEPDKVVEPEPIKKPPKDQRSIKEMPFITCDEFNGVPSYMKSRLTYGQINDVIKEINKAVISKYKILYQPKRSMNSVARNLYHRFINEETKDTKGKMFTDLKLPKQFHVLLSITTLPLVLSEGPRGAGLTRYVI
uniref:SKA complex subunit 1 n=1 Tax=Aotus nancymaae TaxID=37293 RepID=A0A2K5DDU1_AOTNA